VNTFVRYALAAIGVVVAGGLAGVLLGGERVSAAVWVAGALAWLVQLVAFAVLQRVWGKPHEFMIGWLLGMVLRMVVVVVAALWVTRTQVLEAAPMLLSLVAYMFVLVLMEPMFLKKGTRAA
jgi:hypothetical protein